MVCGTGIVRSTESRLIIHHGPVTENAVNGGVAAVHGRENEHINEGSPTRRIGPWFSLRAKVLAFSVEQRRMRESVVGLQVCPALLPHGNAAGKAQIATSFCITG
jgi:hypothetical protein